jgi:hypothetical protein
MEPLENVVITTPCSLPHWEGACNMWINSIKQFCVNFGYTDAPWEYLERTNSSIFAGSLTASGTPSMPETYVMREGRKEQKDQRVDICSIHSTKTIELVEFKMAEYDAIYPLTVKRIESKIREATKQVNNITGIHGNEISDSNLSIKRTVAVLGLPFFSKETNKSDMEDGIQNIINELRGSIYDIKAWVFPPEYIENGSLHYGGKYYVGTFVVAKTA